MAAHARSSIPITVRQLEAVVRIAEALAKLQLAPVATEAHVDEALRLFLASTMDAVNQGANAGGSANGYGSGGSGPGGGPGGANGANDLMQEVARLEDELRRRLPIGWSTSLAALRREFLEGRSYSEQALNRALYILQRRDAVQLRAQGTQIYRSGV